MRRFTPPRRRLFSPSARRAQRTLKFERLEARHMLSGSDTTTQTFTNNTPIDIIDQGTITSTINVSGMGAYLWDLNLETFITHTWNADLDITLTSPQGTVVTITTANGGNAVNVFNGTIFDDSAPTPVSDFPYVSGQTATPLTPEEAFGAFIGEDPNGDWTLEISDTVGADVGTLSEWSLEVTTIDAAPVTRTDSVTNDVDETIVDTASSTITVSGLPSMISDVNLSMFITHTWNADLDITLTSPQGTTVTITTGNGGDLDDVFNGTFFDDYAGATNAPGPVTDAAYNNAETETPLVVEGALAAFIGENPNGDWILSIVDTFPTEDNGTLSEWTLEITTCLEFDFGDAPDTYGTLLADDGARHIITGAFLGAGVDNEDDGFPSTAADGDDADDTDDEDAIVSVTGLAPGAAATITILVGGATANSLVDAYIDFDQSGTFEAGELITPAGGLAVVDGNNDIDFTVPAAAMFGPTYLRLRISEVGGLGPTGLADSGEVEDHLVDLSITDFGDAPSSYLTLLADDGARHIVGGPRLGTLADTESEGQASAAADGDDNRTTDDEDGVSLGLLVVGEMGTIMFDVSGADANTRIDAFIDFDQSGTFDAGERITPAGGLAVIDGSNSFDFSVPAGAEEGSTFTRVRISSTGGLGVTGEAADGEVEDDVVVIFGRDFGDAPDTYGTLSAADGARHVDRGPRLGLSRDTEADGLPSTDADGDDLDNLDDETGLVSITRVKPGANTTMVIRVTNAAGGAFLDAFLDFNRDGDFDANERITQFGGTPVVNGLNNITFFVPFTAKLGESFVRLRVSSVGGLDPTGATDDGEVEDHGVLIERPLIVTGPDVGNAPGVKVYDAADGTQIARFLAFEETFLGGVRVATGDVNGDNLPDVIVARGSGGKPEVRVFDGTNFQPLPGKLGSFLAFDKNFKGGVLVAAGDVDGDGLADIIVGPDNGFDQESRPNVVRVFSGADGSLLTEFAPLGAKNKNRTGFRIAAADFTGDDIADIIVGTGPSDVNVKTKVKSFDMANLANPAPIVNFKPFGKSFTGGVYVGSGDVNGDGTPDYILGQASGKENRVRVLSGDDYTELANFSAFNQLSRGVRVSAASFDNNPGTEILVGSGPGTGRVRLFDTNGNQLAETDAGDNGGVFVSGTADMGGIASPIVQPLVEGRRARRVAESTVGDSDPPTRPTPIDWRDKTQFDLALAAEIAKTPRDRQSERLASQAAFAQEDFWRSYGV